MFRRKCIHKYDEILKIIKEKYAIGHLILLSLGMTATVFGIRLGASRISSN